MGDHRTLAKLGAYPVAHLLDKYFPPVSWIDGAAGDRNLVCRASRSRNGVAVPRPSPLPVR